MTSTERILQYTKLDQEAEEHTSVIPPANWPNKGKIQFDNMHLSYTPEKPVLKNIDIQVNTKEKATIFCIV